MTVVATHTFEGYVRTSRTHITPFMNVLHTHTGPRRLWTPTTLCWAACRCVYACVIIATGLTFCRVLQWTTEEPSVATVTQAGVVTVRGQTHTAHNTVTFHRDSVRRHDGYGADTHTHTHSNITLSLTQGHRLGHTAVHATLAHPDLPALLEWYTLDVLGKSHDSDEFP